MKGYKVVIPEEVKRKIDAAPKAVRKELERIIRGFESGTIDPVKIGEPYLPARYGASDEEIAEYRSYRKWRKGHARRSKR